MRLATGESVQWAIDSGRKAMANRKWSSNHPADTPADWDQSAAGAAQRLERRLGQRPACSRRVRGEHGVAERKASIGRHTQRKRNG
jgi:hypothetical protein